MFLEYKSRTEQFEVSELCTTEAIKFGPLTQISYRKSKSQGQRHLDVMTSFVVKFIG